MSALPRTGPRHAREIRRRIVVAYVVLFVSSVAGAFGAVAGQSLPLMRPELLLGIPGAFAVVLAALLLVMGRRIDRALRHLEHQTSGLQHAYDRARLDALRDGLTGLGNHRAFHLDLEGQIAEARADGTPVGLLMVDVDDLKAVNDARGHVAGDDLLRAVALVMRANLRREDRAYRIGGDEFAMILSGADAASAEITANHLLSAAIGGHHGSVGTFSLTIGVSAFPEPSADRQQLIVHADAALYSGKRHGRTAVERFDPERHGMAEDPRALPELAAAVVRVAHGSLLTPVYQPIFDLRTGCVVGWEGLVRPAPGSGFDDPSSLFLAAEATQRTVELDVASARAVLAGASDLRPGCYLSINLSPRTLEAEAFSPLELIAMARRAGVLEDQLVIEITEREEIEDLTRLRAALDAFRRRGVRVAIDDVGAGNAGLRLLSEVQFDVMKVDLTLVRAGARDGASEAVLRALIDLARTRHGIVVAEGIETADQLEALLEMRIDAGQGFLLARPGPGMTDQAVDLFRLIADD